MDEKWKPADDFDPHKQRPEVSGEQVLKRIRSGASINDMKNALMSQASHRVLPDESHASRDAAFRKHQVKIERTIDMAALRKRKNLKVSSAANDPKKQNIV